MIAPVSTAVTDVFAWGAIALFLGGWLLEARSRRFARWLATAGLVSFAGMWLLLIPHYSMVMRAPIEAVLAAVAVAGCLYGAYLLHSGRDSVLILVRAVAVMGLVYLPFESIPLLRRWLVETVAYQTFLVATVLGFDLSLEYAPHHGYESALVFGHGQRELRTFIVLACTGIGSISIFAGLIAVLDAPVRRRLLAIGVASAIIYLLNIVRNVFIAVSYGYQWFQVFVDPIMAVTGYSQPALVSFFIADRVISQGLAVVVLIGITLLVVRIVPEILLLLEEALFLVTGTDYDLEAALTADGSR